MFCSQNRPSSPLQCPHSKPFACKNREKFEFKAWWRDRREREKWGEGKRQGLFFISSHFSLNTYISPQKPHSRQGIHSMSVTQTLETFGRNLEVGIYDCKIGLGDLIGPIMEKQTLHIPSFLPFLGDLAKSDYTVEKLLPLTVSLQNFAQIQMFRNENVASKC